MRDNLVCVCSFSVTIRSIVLVLAFHISTRVAYVEAIATYVTTKCWQAFPMDSLLRALVRYSEKAASIARALRREDGIFHDLVEEKEEHEKNKKFAKDMKTLADVLIQAGFKHDIEKEVGCRELGENQSLRKLLMEYVHVHT